MMHIGVDFDNTIVCCDPLFYRAAREQNLVPDSVGPAKSDVRNYLREQNKESHWTELQGYVYGFLLAQAHPFPGVFDFFKACIARKTPVSIISHKTARPFLGEPYDLHKAALDWLAAQRLMSDDCLRRDHVFLELTKEAKLRRIASQGCTHFIDDLPEFLLEPQFPGKVERVLFDPSHRAAADPRLIPKTSWKQITSYLLNQ
jgi:hypothetical protein